MTPKTAQVMEWMLILGYICFAVGGVLLVAGFARLLWWGLTAKKRNQKQQMSAHHANPNFQSYYRDPWLRAPSMASIISRQKDTTDGGSLRADTDDIYALPADQNSRGIYLQSSPPTDHELSQTESQIYGEGANGSSSSKSNLDGTDLGDPWSSNIYSVLSKMSNQRGHAVSAIDEENDSGSGRGPAIPDRRYLDVDGAQDGGSLTEADRSSMRELSYVDPPTDYSPERRIPNIRTMDRAQRVDHSETDNSWVAVKPTPKQNGNAAHGTSGPPGSRPRELSGEDLYQATAFRNSYGEEVSGQSSTPGAGSLKSMRSLYQYMYTEEPCALDNEMEYSFTSSVH